MAHYIHSTSRFDSTPGECKYLRERRLFVKTQYANTVGTDDCCADGYQTCSQVPTECSQAPTECSQAPTECSQAPTECSQAPTECSQAPTECSQVPTECSQAPTECSQAPTECSRKDSQSTVSVRSFFGRDGSVSSRGAVSLMLLLGMVVIMLAVALVWNYQIMILHKSDLQNQADLIAMAGAKDTIKFLNEQDSGIQSIANSNTFSFGLNESNIRAWSSRFYVATTRCFDENEVVRANTQMAGASLGNLTGSGTSYDGSPQILDSSAKTSLIPFLWHDAGGGTVRYHLLEGDNSKTNVTFPLYVVVKLTKPKRLIVDGDAGTVGSRQTVSNYTVYSGVRIDCVRNTSAGGGTSYSFPYQMYPIYNDSKVIPN